MAVQPSLCQAWLETLKTGFLMKQLICYKDLLSFHPCVFLHGETSFVLFKGGKGFLTIDFSGIAIFAPPDD